VLECAGVGFLLFAAARPGPLHAQPKLAAGPVEVNALDAAIARAIALHPLGPGLPPLPAKDGERDRSLAETLRPIRKKTGARYALLAGIRDACASGEPVAATIAFGLCGIARGRAARLRGARVKE
jgi:hypothetical protein